MPSSSFNSNNQYRGFPYNPAVFMAGLQNLYGRQVNPFFQGLPNNMPNPWGVPTSRPQTDAFFSTKEGKKLLKSGDVDSIMDQLRDPITGKFDSVTLGRFSAQMRKFTNQKSKSGAQARQRASHAEDDKLNKKILANRLAAAKAENESEST